MLSILIFTFLPIAIILKSNNFENYYRLYTLKSNDKEKHLKTCFKAECLKCFIDIKLYDEE